LGESPVPGGEAGHDENTGKERPQILVSLHIQAMICFPAYFIKAFAGGT
jgi:hypothetical protein